MVAQQREELFGATALVALQVSDHDQVARRSAARKSQVRQRVAIVSLTCELRKQRDAETQRDELFQRGHLRASHADARLEIMVAKERANLRGQRARVAERNEALFRQILDVDLLAARKWMVPAHHQHDRLAEQRLD